MGAADARWLCPRLAAVLGAGSVPPPHTHHHPSTVAITTPKGVRARARARSDRFGFAAMRLRNNTLAVSVVRCQGGDGRSTRSTLPPSQPGSQVPLVYTAGGAHTSIGPTKGLVERRMTCWRERNARNRCWEEWGGEGGGGLTNLLKCRHVCAHGGPGCIGAGIKGRGHQRCVVFRGRRCRCCASIAGPIIGHIW